MVLTGIVCGAIAREEVLGGGARGHALRHAVEVRVPAEQAVPPPVPMLPRYGANVTPGSPLAWHLIDGTDGAEVELSPTPTFAPGQTTRLRVDGETVKLPPALRAGMWFWRLRGVSRGLVGDRTTPTWMLDVAAPAGDPTWG